MGEREAPPENHSVRADPGQVLVPGTCTFRECRKRMADLWKSLYSPPSSHRPSSKPNSAKVARMWAGSGAVTSIFALGS